MLDNGHSQIVEDRKVQFTVEESSMKSIYGVVDLLSGIFPVGSAQIAEFQWVSPQGFVTPVDIQLIHDQLERFTNSRDHMLHAKIKPSSSEIVADVAVYQQDSSNVGVARDGVVALKSKKSAVDCSSC
jgi:hypothetical protein